MMKNLLLLFSISCSFIVSGQVTDSNVVIENTYHIKGVVVDKNKKPIPNAVIELQKGLLKKTTLLTAISNQDGSFIFHPNNEQTLQRVYLNVKATLYKPQIVKARKYTNHCYTRYLFLDSISKK